LLGAGSAAAVPAGSVSVSGFETLMACSAVRLVAPLIELRFLLSAVLQVQVETAPDTHYKYSHHMLLSSCQHHANYQPADDKDKR
jgi:hypothetical protein